MTLSTSYLELKNCRFIDLRILEDIEVERPAQIAVFAPDVGSYTHLEGVHSAAVVLQLLVSVFSRVIVVLPVVIAHVETF